MCIARNMGDTYETNREVCSRYVHSTSRGHEAIQLAAGLQMKATDFLAPYYRDESLLLAIGLTREQARSSIRFSLGRTNTVEQVDALVEALGESVAHLRKLSPAYV